jgi:hypothetical protein
MRLVFACPNGEYLTCVKVKGVFRFGGFESLFGTRDESDSEPEEDLDSSLTHYAELGAALFGRHASELGVSTPPEEGRFWTALLFVCFAIEQGLSREEHADYVPYICGMAARACPDLLVHEFNKHELTAQSGAFVLSTLAALHALRVAYQEGTSGEQELGTLSQRYGECLALCFAGGEPSDPSAFAERVSEGFSAGLSLWSSLYVPESE